MPDVVDLAAPAPLVLGGGDRLTRVLQRVRLRLTTPRGSAPLDRRFGIDPDVLDAPASPARLRAAVADALRGDPDVRLVSVDVVLGPDVPAGALPVRVTVEVLPA